MRDAARALDDVSDHLGEVVRRADDLLAEWGRFGAQVRDQVEREAAAIGEVVDAAVGRAAATGIDRAIADRLRALTTELERIEQRARAASRAVVEQREADRRILWAVVAGIVLANALLVVLILRKPDPAPVAEPVRLEAPAPAAAPGAPDPAGPAAAGAGATEPAGAAAGAAAGAHVGGAEAPGAGQGATTGSAAMAGSAATGSAAPAAPGAIRPANAGSGAPGGTRPVEAGPRAPVAPPARPGAPHPHKRP